MDTHRFSMEDAAQAPGWLQSMKADAAVTSESEEYGIQNFVYRWASSRGAHAMCVADVSAMLLAICNNQVLRGECLACHMAMLFRALSQFHCSYDTNDNVLSGNSACPVHHAMRCMMLEGADYGR